MGDSWTDGEIRTLDRLYREHGPSWNGWKEALPNRSESSIRSKANMLGIRSPSSRLKWANHEMEAIREHFPERGPNWWGWSVLLDNRSARAIDCMARKMGLRRSDNTKTPEWTNAQRKRLVLAMKEMVGSTGMDVYECMSEYVRLRRSHRPKDCHGNGVDRQTGK